MWRWGWSWPPRMVRPRWAHRVWRGRAWVPSRKWPRHVRARGSRGAHWARWWRHGVVVEEGHPWPRWSLHTYRRIGIN